MPKGQATAVSLCIIGDGYSAAALLLHMASSPNHDALKVNSVAVVGKGRLGAGQAFGCLSDHYRLNVRAGLMQLWPEHKSHFADWAEQNITDASASTEVGMFHRRRDFANYIETQLEAFAIPSLISQHRRHATELTRAPEGWRVCLDDDSEILANRVVMATGNPPPTWPFPIEAEVAGTQIITSPWRGDWLKIVTPAQHVAIIGGGLTALDAVHGLNQKQHDGPITIVTPHGMLPPVQTGWQLAPEPLWPDRPTALSFLQCMRTAVGNDDWRLTDWQERFEGLRVDISAAWMRMPAAHQNRLMRRLGWLWSLARFRAGPQAHASATQLLESGQLKVIPERAVGLSRLNNGELCLHLQTSNQVTCDVVVNCSGAGKDQLLSRMLSDGVIARHQTATSRPAITDELALIRPGGSAYDTLFALGPMTSHVTGDVLGAASISRQAKQLSQILSRQMA